jgi:phosphotriesterase-related protein
VTGAISPSELGVTLPHEHIFIDRSRQYGLDAYLGDVELAVREVQLFKDAGGVSIVDCSTKEILRSPLWLREVSQRTGVNVVMGTGHYRHPYLDNDWMDAHAIDEIAQELIRDLDTGVGDTGIRAGVIGEIGSNGSQVSAIEERSFRAAARAHLATGASITTHAALFPVGHWQLDILLQEGVPAHRIVVGHSDTVASSEYHVSLAERGAFVQFDSLHVQSEYDINRRVEFVLNMVKAGHGRRLLLSHDICLRSHLTTQGGKGYTFLLKEFIPRLLAAGLPAATAEEIIADNPRRALSGEE